MRAGLAALDRQLAQLRKWHIEAMAACAVAVIAAADYATGYEISFSIFYLMPVAAASWYAGRRACIGIAALACVSWIVADLAAGHHYTQPAIPVWNALVRLGFFLVNGFLVVALRRSHFHQRELARTDGLTGLFSRRAFEERLEHDLEHARRGARPLTVAFIDLDDFKALNDARGHVVGDQALRATARVLRGATRRVDSVGRLGGDEFGLALPDTPRHGAEGVIAQIVRDLREALGPVAPGLSCSIGVVTFNDAFPQVEDALRSADELMYRAKRSGKNAVVFSEAGEAAPGVAEPAAARAG